ncbi:MAG: amidinotransferase [Flavobacteriales bacterium]|nr:amidinotransferase [Flavobacteriales bacterium]
MSRTAAAVILIRPTGFGHDPGTAATNGFQAPITDPGVRRMAAEEFDELLHALRHCGVGITVLDPFDPGAPNAVFPNNWFSTHADGTLVVYPMLTPSRRAERDPDLQRLLQQEGFAVSQVHDLSAWEQKGAILEGTGSLVLERGTRSAFACLSPRTTEGAVMDWCARTGYTPITFTATMDGRIESDPVYHTNVVMSIGERFAVACFEAMPFPAERQEVDEELRKAGRQVIPISIAQMHKFVGNMLELRGTLRTNGGGNAGTQEHFIFLSTTAFEALWPEQRQALQQYAQLVPVPVPTIESVGGGSVRCMLAENFLPRS